MAAARQKEMKVSITEEATMSRTRSWGGATVVREEAIALKAGRGTGGKNPSSETTALRRVYFPHKCMSTKNKEPRVLALHRVLGQGLPMTWRTHANRTTVDQIGDLVREQRDK
jgi:hypothetical protein